MKYLCIKKSSLLIVAVCSVWLAAAQQRNSSNRTQPQQPTPATNPPNTPAAPAGNAAQPTQAEQQKMPELELKLPVVRRSLRQDHIFRDTVFNKNKEPLPYEDIRPDDATYIQRVWQEIDIHEKLNMPFTYKGNAGAGDQQFITMLLHAIQKEEIVAFDAREDDKFTTPISFKDISEMLAGKPRVIDIPIYNDSGVKTGSKQDTVIDDYRPEDIERYWIKEDWVYDKESSRMHVRIIGLAPLITRRDPQTKKFLGATPLFWVYYPDLRPLLARSDVYLGKNLGNQMSWAGFFEGRMFASRIIKSTIDNPGDMFIHQYIKDPILALLEGQNVKEKILNYELQLWEY